MTSLRIFDLICASLSASFLAMTLELPDPPVVTPMAPCCTISCLWPLYSFLCSFFLLLHCLHFP
uniref:Uncharacterized protein n=1 Tax=Arundo donax TaxID=35708 RepID=A0A0A9FKA1_ARUDO